MPILPTFLLCVQRLHECFTRNHVISWTWRARISLFSRANWPLLSAKPHGWCSLLPEQPVWSVCWRSWTLRSWLKGALWSGTTNRCSGLALECALRIIHVITWSWNLGYSWLMLLLNVVCGSIQCVYVYIIGAYAGYTSALFAFVLHLEVSECVADGGFWGIL